MTIYNPTGSSSTPSLQQVTDVGATTTVESTFSTGIVTPQLKASTSAGQTFKTNSGADWLHGGNGGSANATMYGGWNYDNATANTIASFGASKTLTSLSTSTYPSLTELSYVKGVTSAIQTQLDGKQASGTYVTGATNSSLSQSGTTLSLNTANSNTYSAQQIFNKADTSTVVNPPSNLVINFTADGSGFYADNTNYSYIIYSYQGGVHDIVGTANNAYDPDDANYYYVDLGWTDASVDGYHIYDVNNNQYYDAGNVTTVQITPSTSWISGTPPSSPSVILTPNNALSSQNDKDIASQNINVLEFGSAPLRFLWDYTNQYLKIENTSSILQTLRANISADSINSSSFTGAWNGSPITNAYISGGIDATKIGSGSVSNTEFSYLDGVTSAIQTQLNSKQATLVSGTNIKTINSTSLLGSGDISISSTPAGSNTQIQYNNSGAFGANSLFTFDGNSQGIGVATPLTTRQHLVAPTASYTTITGTITSISAGNWDCTVTGSGTLFTTELRKGDTLAHPSNNSITGVVTRVISDTSCVIMGTYIAGYTGANFRRFRAIEAVDDSSGNTIYSLSQNNFNPLTGASNLPTHQLLGDVLIQNTSVPQHGIYMRTSATDGRMRMGHSNSSAYIQFQQGNAAIGIDGASLSNTVWAMPIRLGGTSFSTGQNSIYYDKTGNGVSQTIKQSVESYAQNGVQPAYEMYATTLGFGTRDTTWNNYFGGTLTLNMDSSGNWSTERPFRLKGYTVATLPTGVQGMEAFVTDALAPAYGSTLVGGGAVVARAFFNGTNWINA